MTDPVRKQKAMAGGAISYLEWEADAPLLHFAHANGFNAQTYRALLSPLAGRFRIVASDLRGHGFTTLPATAGLAKGWRIYRDDLLAFLDALGGGAAILAGHSMGAVASMMAAAEAPSRARAVLAAEPVLVPRIAAILRLLRLAGPSTAGFDMVERAARRRDRFASFEDALAAYHGRGAFKTWPEETIADYLRGGLVPAEGGGFRLVCAPVWEAENFRTPCYGAAWLVGRIDCPFTLIHGENGTARPSEVAVIAGLRPDMRRVGIKGAGHFLPMEKPQAVRAEILRFAETLTEAA